MKTIGLTVLFFILCTFAEAGVVPFDPMRGLVEIDVTIDGRFKGKFGVDTGADRIYIDREFAKKNGLKVGSGQPQRPVAGAMGSSEAWSVSFRSLEMAGERLYNLDATAIDMAAFIPDDKWGRPDGLIGYDLLQRFYVTVDYPHRELDLQMSEPVSLRKDSLDMVSFRNKRHLILVDVTLNDSIKVPMILDYCASQVFVSPDLARMLGMNPDKERRGILKRVSLSDKIVSLDVPVVVSDYTNLKKGLRGIEFEGILGAGFLFQHKITIDYKRNRIYRHCKD
ncbi:MAG: retropepsin-like domain-containing protein [candidate division Zixibacteria bacterium]|nr:retropepsin-like domain-containing protein [candidate division Zixibacteria bacterium]